MLWTNQSTILTADACYVLFVLQVFVVVTGGGNLYPQVDSAIDSGFILSAKPLK